MEYINEVGGGAQCSPPRYSSLASWSRYSSLNQSGGAVFEPPFHHLEDDDNVGDEQPPTALFHPTKMEWIILQRRYSICLVRWCRTNPPL